MNIDWKKIDDQTSFSIPARPSSGLWTIVRSYVTSGQIIRLEARGKWRPIPGFDFCDADGLSHWVFARDRLLCKKAPLGALIGKIGGSNAATEDADVFLVGSLAVISVDKALGPLYLTINDAPELFADNEGQLDVTVG
jgi:hypothetical protein